MHHNMSEGLNQLTDNIISKFLSKTGPLVRSHRLLTGLDGFRLGSHALFKVYMTYVMDIE